MATYPNQKINFKHAIMKTILLFLLLFALSSLNAQWQTVETYRSGTKITYYKDACDTSIPGSENKLTFCDGEGNLGIVEKSYGLNDRLIIMMAPNYYNQDEVFVTYEGLSIHKEDGSWQNIPKFALPRYSFNSSAPSLARAIVHSDGKIYYYHGNMWGLHWIDLETMETGVDNFNQYTSYFTSDPENGRLFSFYVNASTTNFVIKEADGTISNQPIPAMGGTYVNKMLYNNGFIYFITNQGIFKVDSDNLTDITQYGTEELALDFTQITDAAFDPEGNLWLAVPAGSASRSLVRFNPATLTSNIFQTQNSTGQLITFKAVQPKSANEIWAIANNFSGLIQLNLDAEDNPQWNLKSLEDLEAETGYNLISNFNDVRLFNQKMYLLGNSGAAHNTAAHEILIQNNLGNWSGISNSAPQNLSSSFTYRYTANAYTDRDGVWWSNAYDDIIFRWNYDDTFYGQKNVVHSINSGIITDADQAPVVVQSSVKKIYPPAVFDLPRNNNQIFTLVKRYQDQIWAWDNSNQTLTVYRNNQMVANYSVENLPSTYHFDIDQSRQVWFANYNSASNELNLYEFNPETETIIPHVFSMASPGSLRKIVAANGYLVFLFSNAVIVYNGTELNRYDSTNYQWIGNLRDVVVDEEGGIHLLRNDPAEIISLSNVMSDNPIITGMRIEGNESITPFVGMYRPNALVLDYQGHFWTHASNNWMKIKMNEIPQPYLPEGVTAGVTGLVYLDNNENNQYDEGEEYPNQKVTMVEGDYTFTTFTGTDGRFFFVPNQIGQNHRVSLTSFSPFVRPVRIQGEAIVISHESDTDLGTFELEPVKVKGLVAKSSEKQGLWAFERPGFVNAFTTAIGSISNSRTYNNLEVEYSFIKNEGDEHPLPDIASVEVYKISPNTLYPIIQDVQIEPRGNRWWINSNPDAFTQSLEPIVPQITVNQNEVKTKVTLPQILPYEVFIIKINTELFAAQGNGTVVKHGVSKVNGPDLGGTDTNPQPSNFDLIPREENPNLGTPSEFNPYIHPDDVYDDIPFDEPKDFYIPPPQTTRIYSSYDPNDKLVSPGLPDEVNQQDINDKWLYYTLRFENMGNFSAKDIAIIDTLDTNLDLNTFTLYESSHPVEIKFINIDNVNLVKFDFRDIYLDYTDNDPLASQGYVKYWIRAKEDIALETIVENSASIYFDQNPPIYTNITQNQFVELQMSTSDFAENSLIVKYFPNPVKDVLNLKFPETNNYTLQVFDFKGKQILHQNVKNVESTILNLNGLMEGSYILTVQNSKGEKISYKILKK